MSGLDFNRSNLSEQPLNQLINELIEHAEPPSENYRQYLGASAIGSECLRRVQYDWMCDPVFPGRIKDIFARGHFFEDVTRRHLIAAGFKFAPKADLAFRPPMDCFAATPTASSQRDRSCRESFTRAFGSTRRSAVKDGAPLSVTAWLGFTKSTLRRSRSTRPISTAPIPRSSPVVNADTCERLHFAVPFDAQLAQAASDRAVAVIEATRAGELLPRITEDPDDWRCKICSHKERCWR